MTLVQLSVTLVQNTGYQHLQLQTEAVILFSLLLYPERRSLLQMISSVCLGSGSIWVVGFQKVLKSCTPYLFELRHPVPRPNFERVPLFKNSKGQYIVGAANNDNDPAHEEDLECEPKSS